MTTELRTTSGGPRALAVASAYAILLSLVLSTLSLGAWAHEGEDHGEAAAPIAVAGMAPGASAQTEDFELVTQVQGSTLTFTLDRFATNAPVVDAQIEVESDSILKQTAMQISPGVYAVQGTPFGAAGSYPVNFFVQAGDTSDLIVTTLEVAAPNADADRTRHSVKWVAWVTWGAAAAVLIFGLTFVLMRRRKRIRHHAQ